VWEQELQYVTLGNARISDVIEPQSLIG
jgi:hypothetical protein